MPKIGGFVEGGMKNAGPRNVYVSWVITERGPIKPTRCVEVLMAKLRVLTDRNRRPFGQVRDSTPGRNRAGDVTPTPRGVPAAEAESIVPGHDALWTDFIAVVTSEYALANRGRPHEPGAGEFAQALDTLDAARDPAARVLWVAVVENLPWRNLMIAGQCLGDIEMCHILTNGTFVQAKSGNGKPTEQDCLAAEIISLDEANIDQHLGAAVLQLVDHPRPGGCTSCRAAEKRSKPSD
jgi:hypothetical protein